MKSALLPCIQSPATGLLLLLLLALSYLDDGSSCEQGARVSGVMQQRGAQAVKRTLVVAQPASQHNTSGTRAQHQSVQVHVAGS